MTSAGTQAVGTLWPVMEALGTSPATASRLRARQNLDAEGAVWPVQAGGADLHEPAQGGVGLVEVARDRPPVAW